VEDSPLRSAAPEPRNATEKAILDAARSLLSSEGYEGTTIEAIAKKAIVSRTAVYFYFQSKAAILEKLVQQTFADMYAAAAPYLAGNGDPREELRSALARLTAVVLRDADLLLLVARQLGERHSNMPSEWIPYLKRLVDAASRRIERDQERGLAAKDMPAALMSQALCSMIERSITLRIASSEPIDPQMIFVLAELCWRAIYGKPEPYPGD